MLNLLKTQYTGNMMCMKNKVNHIFLLMTCLFVWVCYGGMVSVTYVAVGKKK